MAFDFVGLALDFIEAYGLIAIFVLLVLDGSMLLPVFPGEIVLIMAVAAYATDPASLIFLIVLTSAAGLLGSLLLYGIMRGGGRKVIERFPRFFMMPRRRRERMEALFQKPLGQTLVLLLRVFPLTRVLVNIPAGLAKMPVLRFVILSVIGLVAYHAGFLWFAYQVRRPDSEIGTQAARFQEAYANPAWDFVEANIIITGAAVLLLGIILSIRASQRMHADPEEAGGSLVGTIATAVLFWGGLALAVATYMDPDTVYELAALGGANVDAMAAALGIAPVWVPFTISFVMVFLGFVLQSMRAGAKRRRKIHQRAKKPIAWQREGAAALHPAYGIPPPLYARAPEDEKAEEAEEIQEFRPDVRWDEKEEQKEQR